MHNLPTKSIFRFGIRQKILLILMTILLIALTVSGLFALSQEKENVFSEIKQRGSDISRFVAKSLVYSVVGYDYHTIDLLLHEITLTEDVGYSKVVNLKGNTMAEAGSLIENDPSKMVLFYEALMLDNEQVGQLILGFSTTKTMARLEKQKFTLIGREAFTILLIAFSEFIALSFIIIKPVSIISKSLENKQDGVILGTIPLYSNDEFGELAKQFNELSQNLNNVNAELQSRVDYADQELIKVNNILLQRSGELMDMNEEFKSLSITDPLTGLYNRRHFEDALSIEMEITKRHGDTNSLIVIDIDYFKDVNDKYGHANGDEVIKSITSMMKKRLRETDTLCRIGGEEFVVICKRADKTEAIKIAEEIRKEVAETEIMIEQQSVTVTISLGIATFSKDNIESDAENIFNYADLALYESKNNGRNRVTHYSEIIN